MRRAARMLAVLATAIAAAVAPAHTHADTTRARGSHAPRRHVEALGAARAHQAIVGGHFARNGQFPWIARVLARRGKVIEACTGTVVAARLVLTAGHCAEDLQTGIPREPGEYEVQTATRFAGPRASRSSRVSRVLIYPGFEPGSGIGDAALLELSAPTTAPPIELAGEAGAWPAGTPALMTGWGRTGTATRRTGSPFLHWANTVLQSAEWCASHLRGFNARRQLCAMNSPSDNTAGCAGDSGGPLLVKRAGETVEIGVLNGSVLGGAKAVTCLTTEPTVYANSSVISQWVHEWIERLTSLPVTIAEVPGPS